VDLHAKSEMTTWIARNGVESCDSIKSSGDMSAIVDVQHDVQFHDVS